MTGLSSLFDQYERQARWRAYSDIIGKLGSLQGKNVANLGCGSGYVAEMLEASGSRVTGIDRYADLVALAARQAPKMTWVKADLSDPSSWGCLGI